MSNHPISRFDELPFTHKVAYTLSSEYTSNLAKDFARVFPDYQASPWFEDLGGKSRIVTALHEELGVVGMLIDGGESYSNSVIRLSFEKDGQLPDLICKDWLPIVFEEDYVNPWGIKKDDLVRVPWSTPAAPAAPAEKPKKKSFLSSLFGKG